MEAPKPRIGLKQKMAKMILIPLLIGVIITALVPSLLLYLEGPAWINEVSKPLNFFSFLLYLENDSLIYQENNLSSYANSIAERVQTFLQKVPFP